jgi:hypothetical protein
MRGLARRLGQVAKKLESHDTKRETCAERTGPLILISASL